MKYKPAKNGELIRPKKTGYKMMCCDCGLVHKINFYHIPYGRGRKIVFEHGGMREQQQQQEKNIKGERKMDNQACGNCDHKNVCWLCFLTCDLNEFDGERVRSFCKHYTHLLPITSPQIDKP